MIIQKKKVPLVVRMGTDSSQLQDHSYTKSASVTDIPRNSGSQSTFQHQDQ